jgi:hypothetical protein
MVFSRRSINSYRLPEGLNPSSEPTYSVVANDQGGLENRNNFLNVDPISFSLHGHHPNLIQEGSASFLHKGLNNV